MIVTTCGAAGAFGAFGGGAGDGAGVCADAIVWQSNAPTNNTTEIMRLKFIVYLPITLRRELITALYDSL